MGPSVTYRGVPPDWEMVPGELNEPVDDHAASSCRVRDCRHEPEPGCAVLAAAAGGTLEADRLAIYRKLVAEAAYLERKHDPEARAAPVAKDKSAMKTMKYHPKYRREREGWPRVAEVIEMPAPLPEAL